MNIEPEKKGSLIFSLTVLVCLSAFTIDVCIPAFGDISSEFGVSSGQTHLIISAYLISVVLAQIPLGFLSDKIGRVQVLYLGLLVFSIGGLVTSFSTDLETLLLGRFIQGLGGASGPVIARAIARDISSGVELNKIMTLLVSALAVSTIVAPVIGSLLMMVFHWKSVFAVSLVLGLLCSILVFRYIAGTQPQPAVVSGSFWRHWSLFWKDSNAAIGTLLLGLLFLGYLSLVSSFSTIAADQFHQTSTKIGWWFAGFLLFYLLGSSLARYWVKSVSEMTIIDIGCWILLSAVILFAVMLWDADKVWVGMLGLIGYLLGMGILFGAFNAIVLKKLAHIAGTASGIMGTIQIFSGFIGTIISSILYVGNASSTLYILSVSSLLLLFIYGGNRRRLIGNLSQSDLESHH